jgi:DNA-binding transcriptional LysR family regulator
MNLRQLETFLAVAEIGSFRRAAETLHRSQSAVSMHVQQLEEELGVPLLERTTRRVSLTPQGRTLLTRCKSIVSDIRTVAYELKEESSLRRGRVSIGTAPSISTHRLPPLIAAYQAAYPGVTLELHEAFASGMYDDVLGRVTDFAIGPRLQGLKDFDIEPVMDDPIVAVLPIAYRLNGRRTITLDEIARQRNLSMPKGTAIRQMIEDAFRTRGHAFAPKFEVIHQQTLFSLVEAGLGVTVLPLMSVPPERSGRYQVVPLREPAISREICLIKLKGKTLSPPALRCAELIVQGLQSQFVADRRSRK